ncbi:MAG TPA: type II CAAX endopeptidase family protein [Anaerolineales bacterium]
MNKITNWVKEHQVTTFFILAFAITWPLFWLIYFVFPGNSLVLVLAGGPLAVFSPALAAMLISAISEPHPKQQNGKSRWIAFGVSWFISWLIMTLYYWQVVKLDLQLAAILWAVFALLPAWVLSSAYARTPGIRKHFSSLIRPKGNLIWYFVALFSVPALQILGIAVTRLLGGEIQFYLDMSSGVIFLSLTFFSGFLCSGGINEESGWRGFALPRLQAHYPVILAAGIVWFFWALWHIPYDIGLGTPLEQILFNRIVNNLVFSVLFAWVYNRTKGSILAPALFHPSMNTFGDHFPVTPITLGLFAALAIFAIIYDKMWKKLPSDNPAVYPEPTNEVIGVLKNIRKGGGR